MYSYIIVDDHSIRMSYNRQNRLRIAEFLVQSGADINVGFGKESYPLILLTRGGVDFYRSSYRMYEPERQKLSLPILRFLLANGADPNLNCRLTNSPLLRAVSLDSKDAVQCLLQCNADVNHIGPEGITALHQCCMNQCELL